MGELTEQQLEDARRELARRECLMTGHDYNVIDTLGEEGPSDIVCSRCGRVWHVTR